MKCNFFFFYWKFLWWLNPLTPNDLYSGRTAPTSNRCILYISSTNIRTEYFKQGIYSPCFFSSKCSLFHNSNLFGSCIIHILYTGCAEIKKNNSGAKRLICPPTALSSAIHVAYSITNIPIMYTAIISCENKTCEFMHPNNNPHCLFK